MIDLREFYIRDDQAMPGKKVGVLPFNHSGSITGLKAYWLICAITSLPVGHQLPS